MNRLEYIGISGVVGQEQQMELTKLFNDSKLADSRVLQLGVKATHKSQWLDIENKYGRDWYPVGDEIRGVIAPSKTTTGVAQICFDTELVESRTYRREFMQRLGERSSTWLTGVQFDMLPWHTCPYTLTDTIDDMPVRPEVFLQCHSEALALFSPLEIAQKLGSLAGYIDYVLFDASCGQGKELDTNALTQYLDAAYSEPRLDNVGMAVGGGLNAAVVRAKLPELLTRFPQLSWDAEGQLHPTRSDGKRPLDMQACREYLEACANVLD